MAGQHSISAVRKDKVTGNFGPILGSYDQLKLAILPIMYKFRPKRSAAGVRLTSRRYYKGVSQISSDKWSSYPLAREASSRSGWHNWTALAHNGWMPGYSGRGCCKHIRAGLPPETPRLQI